MHQWRCTCSMFYLKLLLMNTFPQYYLLTTTRTLNFISFLSIFNLWWTEPCLFISTYRFYQSRSINLLKLLSLRRTLNLALSRWTLTILGFLFLICLYFVKISHLFEIRILAQILEVELLLCAITIGCRRVGRGLLDKSWKLLLLKNSSLFLLYLLT